MKTEDLSIELTERTSNTRPNNDQNIVDTDSEIFYQSSIQLR